jgi:NAD-dependent dihydropyrimidine dehydrogenase PreA subunit
MIRASELNTLQYEPELCNGCGTCISVCPHAVFEMNSHKVQFSNPDACMECGACQVNCPTGAIAVDSGVGCAQLMIAQALRGKRGVQGEVTCGGGGQEETACCG